MNINDLFSREFDCHLPSITLFVEIGPEESVFEISTAMNLRPGERLKSRDRDGRDVIFVGTPFGHFGVYQVNPRKKDGLFRLFRPANFTLREQVQFAQLHEPDFWFRLDNNQGYLNEKDIVAFVGEFNIFRPRKWKDGILFFGAVSKYNIAGTDCNS